MCIHFSPWHDDPLVDLEVRLLPLNEQRLSTTLRFKTTQEMPIGEDIVRSDPQRPSDLFRSRDVQNFQKNSKGGLTGHPHEEASYRSLDDGASVRLSRTLVLLVPRDSGYQETVIASSGGIEILPCSIFKRETSGPS